MFRSPVSSKVIRSEGFRRASAAPSAGEPSGARTIPAIAAPRFSSKARSISSRSVGTLRDSEGK